MRKKHVYLQVVVSTIISSCTLDSRCFSLVLEMFNLGDIDRAVLLLCCLFYVVNKRYIGQCAISLFVPLNQ